MAIHSTTSTHTTPRRALPWYKRCPADWRNGTRACGMSMELRGFYSECLDAMWELQGPLPADRKRLALLLGCNVRTVDKLMPKLVELGKMFQSLDGYFNPRMLMDIRGREAAQPAPAAAADAAPAQPDAPPQLDLFAPNSRAIHVEFDAKNRKKPMNSTRERESESDIETNPHIAACVDEIKIEQGRVIIAPDAAEQLRADYPGIDVAAVADLAAPELMRFRRPSADDKRAVVRKWARISLQNAKTRRPGLGRSLAADAPKPRNATLAYLLAKRAQAEMGAV